MPTVPETFGPTVAQTPMGMVPATAPWVSPMKNAAPALLQQTASTLGQMSDTEAKLGNTISDAVQQTVNDGMMKGALTQFQKSAQNILTDPQSGYLFTRGLNAQTQWDATAQALSKAQQDQRARLTNPTQQRAFDLAVNDHMLSIGQQMNAHQHEQVTQFGIQQNQDYADSRMILARDAYLSGNQADYQKHFGEAKDAVFKVAELNGAAPESDVAQAMLRAKTGDLVRGITYGLAENHQPEEMNQYFESQRGNIDMRTADQLGSFVKAEHDRSLTETTGRDALAAAQSKGATPYTYGPLAVGSSINPMKISDVPGSPRPDGRTHDGYDIAMPAGTAVNAPLDGKVVKVWNDQQFGGGLSMRVQLADGNTLGIAHLSATNVNEGDSVNRGQPIALSGKTGNATGGVLHVALRDANMQPIDYFAASKAQPDQAGIADPNVLQRAMDAVNDNDHLDPYQKNQVIDFMWGLHRKVRTDQEQIYQENKQKVVDQLAQNGGNYDALPSDQKALLRPSDALAFQQQHTDQQRQQAEDATRANWIMHPEQQTVSAVDEAYQKGLLTIGGYKTARTEAKKFSDESGQPDDEKIRRATADKEQLDDIYTLNGLGNLARPKSDDDWKTRIQLDTAIKDEINVEQERNNRQLTREEKGKIARDVVSDKVYTSTPTLWMGGTVKPVAATTPDEQKNATVFVGGQNVRMMDIPPQYAAQATQFLQTRGLPTTQANIAAWWLKQGKPAK